MAKKKKPTSRAGLDKSSVPCLRVVVGGKPGKTGQTDAASCAIVGESRGGTVKFDLGRKYRSTSKTVATPGKNKPCFGALKRTGCPVQLAFDDGQPFLRFCTTEKQPGFRVDVNTPAEAVHQAGIACAAWEKNGRKKFDFPSDTPLRGGRSRK